jgi:hypothetical protein
MASFGNFAFEGDAFGFLGWRIKWNFQLALFCVFFVRGRARIGVWRLWRGMGEAKGKRQRAKGKGQKAKGGRQKARGKGPTE